MATRDTFRAMRNQQSGFTLVELVVTMTVAVILVSLAVPSFRSLLANRTVQSAADTLASDFRFARSEAIKRTSKVTICASGNGSTCTGSGALWRNGWIVFVPTASDGSFTSGDEIIRVQDAIGSIASIAATDGTSKFQFVFEATGWSQAAAQQFLVTPSGGSGATARVVCISNKGRPAIRAKGETTCT